jgi:metal-responsive CopG/Arc/MetJ family transcriptional regulator
MSTQISLKLSNKMLTSAKKYSEVHGYENLQDFIREMLRKKLFDDEHEAIGGLFTSTASEQALAKHWLTKEEDKAWSHLQKEI